MYRSWFTRLPLFQFDEKYLPITHFSIVIPARNEENNIEQCLSSVFNNNYPQSLYEVIVIDDESTDATARIVQNMQTKFERLQLLKSADLLKGKKIYSYKKAAIESAIHIANGKMIVTTDADCVVPENWLFYFDNYIQQTHKQFIAAPVVFYDDMTFLGRFQSLDFLSLQGITAASVSAGFHAMCNGANLCYDKNLFLQVKGFEGVDHLASGDDMLLMQKIQKHDVNAIGYLFSPKSIVTTQPMQTWKTFFHQRIRWASKSTVYDDKKIKLVLWLVYLLNLFLLIDFFISLYHPFHLVYWIGLIAVKTTIELLFMEKITAFYQQKNLLHYFPMMQPFHIVYTVVAGFLGKFGKYNWKDRKVQ